MNQEKPSLKQTTIDHNYLTTSINDTLSSDDVLFHTGPLYRSLTYFKDNENSYCTAQINTSINLRDVQRIECVTDTKYATTYNNNIPDQILAYISMSSIDRHNYVLSFIRPLNNMELLEEPCEIRAATNIPPGTILCHHVGIHIKAPESILYTITTKIHNKSSEPYDCFSDDGSYVPSPDNYLNNIITGKNHHYDYYFDVRRSLYSNLEHCPHSIITGENHDSAVPLMMNTRHNATTYSLEHIAKLNDKIGMLQVNIHMQDGTITPLIMLHTTCYIAQTEGLSLNHIEYSPEHVTPTVKTPSNTTISHQQISTATLNENNSLSKNHICPICHKSLGTTQTLNAHILRHNPHLMPFACTYCHKKFPFRSTLEIHIKSHFTIKQLQCDQCNTVCLKPQGLRAHNKYCQSKIVTYSFMTPFTCKDCGTYYSNKSNLSRHIKDSH